MAKWIGPAIPRYVRYEVYKSLLFAVRIINYFVYCFPTCLALIHLEKSSVCWCLITCHWDNFKSCTFKTPNHTSHTMGYSRSADKSAVAKLCIWKQTPTWACVLQLGDRQWISHLWANHCWCCRNWHIQQFCSHFCYTQYPPWSSCPPFFKRVYFCFILQFMFSDFWLNTAISFNPSSIIL